MRVETGNEQAIAALSSTNAARSPAPVLRTGQDQAGAPQQLEVRDHTERGPREQQSNAAKDIVIERFTPRQLRDTRFRVDKATRRIVVQLIDDNNEIIKQVPPQELLDIAARFRRLRGLLFDERA
ncbi:MAG: flagellar protein FlaG [Candidatus Hydrogenedentota bacterium]